MRYGRLRRGSCHGTGLGGVVPRDADALCEQEEHAAPRETKEACAQAVEDRRHGLFELFYRHGDGYSDCALQPSDHAIPRLGRGPIINVSTFVQCCAYSVGQASQPIISTNFGAGKEARIRETLRYALWTVVFFGVFWTAPSVACPNLYIRIFMSPTETILAMAPAIIRAYAISFLLLPFNIFSTYYFQAILQPKAAFIVSVARGLVISGALILMLPLLAGADSLWFAMPITELVTAVYAAACIRRYTARLDAKAA